MPLGEIGQELKQKSQREIGPFEGVSRVRIETESSANRRCNRYCGLGKKTRVVRLVSKRKWNQQRGHARIVILSRC